jgi:hypothetical protein
MSMVLESGEGIEASARRMAATFCRHRRISAARTEVHAAEPVGVLPVLQENLEREIDRAATLEQLDGLVEVDVVARSEDECALGVVARTLELLVPPTLDALDLGVEREL